MNYKRRKPRRQVRCFMCTKYRFLGNRKGRFSDRERRPATNARKELDER